MNDSELQVNGDQQIMEFKNQIQKVLNEEYEDAKFKANLLKRKS